MSLPEATLAALRQVVRADESQWNAQLADVLTDTPAAEVVEFLEGVLAMGGGTHAARMRDMRDHLARGLQEAPELAMQIARITLEQRRLRTEVLALRARLFELTGPATTEAEGWQVSLARPRRRVKVDDPRLVPEAFHSLKVDSKKVLAAWDAGEPVEGTHISYGIPSLTVKEVG